MKKIITSYLAHLRFDQRLAESWHGKYLRTIRLVILLILTILVIGTTSYFQLPRRLNPEVKIPIVTISTLLPGAGPNDVESLVTEPLENAVTGLTGVNTVTSISQENISIISIEFTSSTNQDKALDDVQTAVNTVTSLPTDARTPAVRGIDFEDQPVWMFAVSTSGDDASLFRFAKSLEKKLQDLLSIDRVATGGLETQEIEVVLQPEMIQEFTIDPLSLSRAISAAVSSHPAGSVKTDQSSFSLTIDPAITSIDDVRNLHVSVSGEQILLSSVAIVLEKSKPGEAKSYIASRGLPARTSVSFSVFKKKAFNIDRATEDAKKVLDEEIARYSSCHPDPPAGGEGSQGDSSAAPQNDSVCNAFTVSSILNSGEEVDRQFDDLVGEFRSTIILVFTAMFLFLGLRQALIVSLEIPLTFLSAFAIMNAFGITLNFLSLFSLLLALGLLVDDAVVIASAMTAYYRTKKFTPYETGLLVWRDFIVPIWTTTITTVWAFIPLLLSTGIIGEFIKTIPVVVAATMYSSTAIAILITLPLMIVILKPTIPNRVKILLRILGGIAILILIIFLFRNNPLLPFIIMSTILLAVLTYRIREVLVEKIKTIFFESLDSARDKLASRSSRLRYRFAKTIRNLPPFLKDKMEHGVVNTRFIAHKYQNLIDRILDSRYGRRTILIAVVAYTIFSYLLLPLGFVVNEFFPKSDENILYVSLELPVGTDLNTTDRKARGVLEKIRHTQPSLFIIAEVAKSAPTGFSFGGVAENQILFTLILPNAKVRKETTTEIAKTLRQTLTYDGGKLSVIELSGGPPAGADVQIKLRGDDLAVLDTYADQVIAFLKTQPGITNADKSIKTGTSKLVFVPDRAKLAEAGLTPDSIGLQLRAFASGFTLDTIKIDGDDQDIVFRTSSTTQFVEHVGRITLSTRTGSVPLLSLGNLVMKPNPSVITREDGKRTLSVSAGVETGFSVSQANQKLIDFAKTGLNLPAGYEWATGGVNEENQKSIQSILQAMVLAAVLIMATMVIQFNSYRKAIIVLLVIPIAVSSVFLIFALTGTPLSFPALIGVLSLFGIVVTNSMVIVDKINQNLRVGMTLRNALSDAAANRVEPIMFTSTITILGLIPITLSNPLWRGLGGAIISGLLFSGIIMLFFIPVVYYEWYKGEER